MAAEASASGAAAQRQAAGRLLSRLAALQGQAMPAFRFDMLENGRSGAPLAGLPPSQQLPERWLACFPQGRARQIDCQDLDPGDFPLLWLQDAEARVLLLRGRLANGDCTAENVAGEAMQLTTQDLQKGRCLSLASAAGTSHSPDETPRSAMDWFVHALRKQRRFLLEGVLASLVVSALALFTALYTMQVYDRVIPTSGFETLKVLTIGVLISISLEFMMKQARARIVDRASKRIDIDLSAVFFGKALNIRLDARPRTVGTFAAQIRQFDAVRQFMTASTLFILADAPFALFFIVVIALLAGPVALVPAVMVPLAVLTGLVSSRNMKRLSRLQMEESNRKSGLLIEAIDGIESIKATGADWKLGERYRQLTARLAENELRLRNISVRSMNLAQSLQQLNYVALVAAGAYAVSTGSLTMGGLIACTIISGRALTPISQIPTLISQWHSARIALEALNGIMAMPAERESGTRLIVPQLCQGHIAIEEAGFAYLPEKAALAPASLRFAPGERIAVIGAVGSGKSTLIKLLSGLYRPSGGRVSLDDVDMQQLAPAFLREHIGYLPQDVRLFQGTLRENLTLGLPTPNDSQLLEVAAMTGLDKVIKQHPHGLELMISEGGRGLSGGQRQLVGLTRLLLARPRILLLDEPTASMDAQLEARVMQQLFDYMPRESLIVVVTHKPALLPHVDRIIVVDQGRVVIDDQRDKVAELLRRSTLRPAAGASAPLAQRQGAEP